MQKAFAANVIVDFGFGIADFGLGFGIEKLSFGISTF
jgi:hypothetical protein